MIKATEKPIEEMLDYSGLDYSIQLKINGTRTIWDGTNLISNDGIKRNDRFKEIATFLSKFNCKLDGELALSCVSNVADVSRKENWNKARYYVFDIYELDGIDVTNLPLKDRLALLEGLIKRFDRLTIEHKIRMIPSFPEMDIAWDYVKRYNLEGLVVKNLNLVNPSDLFTEIRLDIKVKNWHETKERIKDWDGNLIDSHSHGCFITESDNRVSALTHENARTFIKLKDLKPLFAEFYYLEKSDSGKFIQPKLKRIIDDENKIYYERMI